ncbi:MAG: ABC transporter substrate-binding protein, partial [Actinomycetota bacterium]
MRARTRWVAGLLVLAAVAAACGDGEDGGSNGGDGELTVLTVATEWPFPDPLWIPFLAAEDRGFYEDAGLDVTIQPPPDNSTTMRMLAGGQAQV